MERLVGFQIHYAMSSSRECHTGIGTQTAGLVFGGITTLRWNFI